MSTLICFYCNCIYVYMILRYIMFLFSHLYCIGMYVSYFLLLFWFFFFFFKQKTAYEMRISDWSSDVCSSDLWNGRQQARARMDIGMVFQQFNLFPHMNVLQNVMVGPLKIRGVERQKATEMALDLLSQVGLADKRDQYPTRLSGGKQQRVDIARALAMKPDIQIGRASCRGRCFKYV